MNKYGGLSYEELQNMSVIDFHVQGEIKANVDNVINNERGNANMGNVMENLNEAMEAINRVSINVNGQNYVPTFKKNYDGCDMKGTAPNRRNSFVAKTMTPEGLAWYENHVATASMPNNIPRVHGEAVFTHKQGYSPIDLSMLTSGEDSCVNKALGLFPLLATDDGRLVAMRTWYTEGRADMPFVLEIALPIICDDQYCFLKDGSLAYTTHCFDVYAKNPERPFVQGLIKASTQKYLGQIDATKKDGTPEVYRAKVKQGDKYVEVDKVVSVAHYCDSIYDDYTINIVAEQYAQIMTFVKYKVGQRVHR